jgi:hypothetical protein
MDDAHAGGSVDAAPTIRPLTIFAGFFLGIVALTTPLLAIRRAHLDDDLAVGSLEATPTGWLTIFLMADRFLL